jgi:outer membrane translocation and assembly module TamA
MAARYRHTAIAHARVDWGSELDRDRQFFADGASGLRGYRLHAFEGDRVAILNLEHRLFLGRELWHVLTPGAAAFVDAGVAGTDRDGWGRVKTDVGVGLRLGLSRARRNLFRLDVAYALDRDPRGERGFVVSFSSGQAF